MKFDTPYMLIRFNKGKKGVAGQKEMEIFHGHLADYELGIYPWVIKGQHPPGFLLGNTSTGQWRWSFSSDQGG